MGILSCELISAYCYQDNIRLMCTIANDNSESGAGNQAVSAFSRIK